MRTRGVVPALAGLCALAIGVAGCGSDSSDDSARGGGGGDSRASAALVKEYEVPQPNTWKGPASAPKPEAGKTIALISSAEVLEGSHRLIVGGQAATEAIGWNSYVCDGKGDPNRQNLCTQQAIQKGVDGIFWAGIDPEVVRQGADAAEEAGIPIVTGYNYGLPSSKPPADISKGVVADVSSDQCQAGKVLAAYMVANTDGGQPKVAMVNGPEYPIVALRYKCTKQALEDAGAEILSTTNIRGADVATKAPALGSSLVQSRPEGTIDWIYAPYDAAALFLGQGVQSAGRDDVKIGSFDANKANLDIVGKGGPQVVDMTSPLEWMGWAAIDTLNRDFSDEPLGQSYGLPVQLLDESNVKNPAEGVDYESEFKKIWGK